MNRNTNSNAGGASASPHSHYPIICGLSALLLLTACGENDTAAGAGGVSVGEARALDEAAQMLDSQRLSDAVLTGEAEETPATE